MRRTSRSISALAIATTLPLLAGVMPARGAPAETSVAMACRASTPIGPRFVTTQSAAISAAAPATVAAGAVYTERLSPPHLPLRSTIAGFPLVDVRDLGLRFRVGRAATVVSVQLVGGQTPGARATISGGVVTVSAPGPVPGGGTIVLPDAVVTLRAAATRGATIVTDVPGTSYDDWTAKLTGRIRVLAATYDLPATCFAQPVGAVLSRTAIS